MNLIIRISAFPDYVNRLAVGNPKVEIASERFPEEGRALGHTKGESSVCRLNRALEVESVDFQLLLIAGHSPSRDQP